MARQGRVRAAPPRVRVAHNIPSPEGEGGPPGPGEGYAPPGEGSLFYIDFVPILA